MSTASSPLAAFHPANALTFASLVCGLGAVAAALDGRAAVAGALVAVAAVCDTFDGRFARLFTRTAAQCHLGAHLDSLSDAISFGVVPVVCVAVLSHQRWEVFAAAPLYAACAIARLAFFNVTHDYRDGFVGLPVPVAALLWSTALLLQAGPGVTAIVIVTAAAAMVVPIAVPRPRGVGLALFVCWPVAVASAHLFWRP